jgi:hypothetical protein
MLLQYAPNIVKGLFSSWGLKNLEEKTIDKNPAKFRIVFKIKRNEFTVLAVSDSKELIDKHWEYVNENLLPVVHQVEESDAVQYIIDKVEGLAKVEEGEAGKKDTKREEFRANFPELEAEKFVTYYEGLLWENGKLTPLKSTIYLLEESIAFHCPPSYKVVLQFYDISSITKEKILGIVSKTIRIVTKDKLDYWINVVNRDAMYQVMEHLWRDAMKRWQYSLDPDGLGLNAYQDRVGTSMAQLDRNVRKQEFQETFKVPESPKSENDIYQAILRPPDRWILGLLYMTDNFLCYRAKQNLVDLKLVIAFVNILEISPHDHVDTRVEEFPDMKGIKVITQSNEYIFCIQNRTAVIQKLLPLWNQRYYYRKKTGKNKPKYMSHNGWTLDEELFSNPQYGAEQDTKKKIWDNYFNRNGWMDDPIISSRFVNIIKQEGIPDIYRGRLWQICSGSIHQLETQPGYYNTLLTEKEGNPTIEAEISRDVTRSLPHHPFFRDGEGVSQLSNILVAYSRRAHHIGYCQAMNIVAATLLLYMSEEEAFWLLCRICEEIIPEHYTKGLQLMGSLVEQSIFTELVVLYFPTVKDHLEEIGTPVDMLTLPWFMTFFIGYIPWKAALRVLDLVFIFGPDILFLIGLAVLEHTKDKILGLIEGMNVTPLFREVCKDNSEQLIQDAFSKYSVVTKELIQNLRQKKKI